MSRTATCFWIVIISIALCTSAVGYVDEPVAILIQPRGAVSYSVDGTTWHGVPRTKFLYEGTYVKTGDNGSCKLINRGTELVERIGNNAELQIHARGTQVLSGNVEKPEPAGSLKGFWSRKLARLQKYVGVQRHANTNGVLKTARAVTLSENYPNMVWENTGSGYAYRLVVGDMVFEVPGTEEDLVRFKLSGMAHGLYDYHVALLFKGEVVYMPERKGKLKWLSKAELAELKQQELRIHRIAGDNGFLLGSLMDEHGLKVAAMDHYRRFLDENPDTNEVRPFMIKVLSDLKLNRSKAVEALVYQDQASR